MNEPIPSAIPIPVRRQPSPIWLIPLAALLISMGIGIQAWRNRGLSIHLHFTSGDGLRSGDTVRHRGVTVGQVTAVGLNEAGDGVEVAVRLAPNAQRFARTGARFWIVRPQLGLDGVSGLDTVVGPRYVAAEPGDGVELRAHAGLERAPLGARDGGLSLRIDAPMLGGLRSGAPVTFRQVTIGRITATRLAADGTAVEIDAHIDAPYIELIRANTVFWNASGIDFSGGIFKGLSVEVHSLANLVAGGLACATPSSSSPAAGDGQRFLMAKEAPKNWQDWHAPLAVGGSLPTGFHAVWPQTARVSCQYGIWDRLHLRQGWASPVSGGWLIPTDLLVLPDGAEVETAQLQIGDLTLTLPTDPGTEAIAFIAGASPPSTLPRRPFQGPEEVLIYGDANVAALPIPSRLIATDGRVPVQDPQWHGGLVRARSDGAWVAILVCDEAGARLIPVQDPTAR